jgi:hypothetical protein
MGKSLLPLTTLSGSKLSPYFCPLIGVEWLAVCLTFVLGSSGDRLLIVWAGRFNINGCQHREQVINLRIRK